MDIIAEIYQFLFISSIVFIVYVLGDLAMKTIARFAFKTETRFSLVMWEKLILWASIAMFFTYIIN